MRLQRRKRQDPEPPLASMADIAFLLIIFFLLTTTFMKEANAKYELPKDATVDNLPNSPISITMDENGKIYLQGQPCKLESLQGAVQAMLSIRKEKGDTQNLIHFKCDKNLTRKTFEPALIAISDAGGVIALMGDPVQEDKP